MAESTQEMQALLDICQSEITRLGLCFNVKKTTLLRLAGECTKDRGSCDSGRCRSEQLEYKYLGVKLSSSTDMYSLHEVKTREVGLRAQCILWRRCLWGCKRYLMVHDLWKLVHVLGLTFANAVVTISAATREWLERRQREVGSIALGCHGMVANEAVQGDIGWSSFEARAPTRYKGNGLNITIISAHCGAVQVKGTAAPRGGFRAKGHGVRLCGHVPVAPRAGRAAAARPALAAARLIFASLHIVAHVGCRILLRRSPLLRGNDSGAMVASGAKGAPQRIGRHSVLAEAAQEFLLRSCKKHCTAGASEFPSVYFPTMLAAVSN
ncbi:hypothetical protein HPB50_006840 [Hyalomma asiaticum]|uniref:Uncharacterized protein n=1 Tax=Hyalomma asiaticum TaxID=266040 RepID=A0ACB7RKL0_HYAAI|nr:hypothetical protein HPB50_006840 [Hyalomma asiaticum]